MDIERAANGGQYRPVSHDVVEGEAERHPGAKEAS
jgi:hypothetical protein